MLSIIHKVDDFEEVVIPDIIDPKKPKGKTQAKVRQTTGTTRPACSKQKLTQKPISTTRTKHQNTKTNQRKNRSVDTAKKSPSLRDDVSAPSEGEEETSGKKPQGIVKLQRRGHPWGLL
jgi:hypothetical protein